MSKLSRVLLTFFGLGIAYSGILVLSDQFKMLPEPLQTNIAYSILGMVMALAGVLAWATITGKFK